MRQHQAGPRRSSPSAHACPVASPSRFDVDRHLARLPRRLHHLRQRHRRSRWRVQLADAWCVSSIENLYPAPFSAAPICSRQLQHHLHADRKVRAIQQPAPACARPGRAYPAACRTSPSSRSPSSRPVARQARMFCTAASGVVKSITTSKPATNGGVSAAASWFSFASST